MELRNWQMAAMELYQAQQASLKLSNGARLIRAGKRRSDRERQVYRVIQFYQKRGAHHLRPRSETPPKQLLLMLIIYSGGPALWTPPELPFTIEARTDTRKTTPGIPSLSVQWHHIFTPLQVMQPGYSLNPVSVVSTATMIAECYQFLRKFSFPNFTLHATAEQGTLFLRKQLPVRAQQNDSPIPKFISSRHQLQKLCFKYPTALEETHRHHRLIEYDIAGTKWLIDNSADGYQPGLDTPTIESIPSDRDPDAAPDITRIGHCTVIKAGFLVPQESLMVVRSAANHSKQTINSSTAGALFSQIPKMVLVKHNRGTIKSFLHINQFPNTLRQRVLGQLLVLLREIKEAAEACESGTCRIVLRKENLDQFEMDILPSANEGTFLTDEIKDRFWSKDGNVETATELDTEA
ncbi:uncharacterized protein PAC_12498 [Phialocephala subalpina]|uniref:Uncharacterized protein n=1 Tax=Phialocephala subalpina TaxID=576137 RepID=A0A1L7XC52_9HELO|nr:uncharacterized protein PAC_12498 [Phialocephala subalpina]